MKYLKFLLPIVFTFSVIQVLAQDSSMQIVDVRRNITMSDDEKPYKDFYISISSKNQLKINQEVSVLRKLSIKDSTGAQSFGEIRVPVAKLKIIATYDRIAIAREVELISREKEPMLESLFVMSGDEVQ